MNFTLPAIDSDKKWRWAAGGYLLFCIGYLLTGNLHFKTPVVLSPSGLDDLIPFTDWTIWIYHSQFFFLVLTVHVLRRADNLTRLWYAMALASLFAFGVFLIYPTTIARVAPASGGLAGSGFHLLYAMDAPTNCFPSLHVALAALAAAAIWREFRRAGWIAIFWALFIMLSTITTKQHYVIDVVGGLLIALCSYALVKKIA